MDLRGRIDLDIRERLRLQSVYDPATGCLLLTKKPCSSGYCQIRVGGKLRIAHVVAFELAGKVLPPGTEIDHTCNRPNCIAPEHLEAVTHSQNIQRAFDRGTKVYVPRKLTAELAAEIRSLYAAGGITQKELSLRFGISRTHVCGIITRHRWGA